MHAEIQVFKVIVCLSTFHFSLKISVFSKRHTGPLVYQQGVWKPERVSNEWVNEKKNRMGFINEAWRAGLFIQDGAGTFQAVGIFSAFLDALIHHLPIIQDPVIGCPTIIVFY